MKEPHISEKEDAGSNSVISDETIESTSKTLEKNNKQNVPDLKKYTHKTVLIVEDNELNMKLFNDLLEVHGIQTVQSNNGLEVLDLAKEHMPDLILMDIQLPEVSGLDVIKWLKNDATLKDIPVIAVTAFAMKGDEEKIRDGGCEDYISKPIAVVKFLEVVNRYLQKTPDKEA